MTERKRDRTSVETGHIVNPAHPIPDEVADGLGQFREGELAALARLDKIASQARPTEEERRSIAKLYEPAAHALGIDVEKLLQRHREVGANQLARIKEAQRGEVQRRAKLLNLDHEVAPPADHSFWLARGEWGGRKDPGILEAGPTTLEIQPDGLHVQYDLYSNDGDLNFAYIYVVSTFELQPNRIPPSSTGMWRSRPHVQLFGSVGATTLTRGWFPADAWAKLFMHRRQTILQFVPGGNFPIIIAEGKGVQALIQEENQQKSVFVQLPGYQAMPELRFSGFNLNQSLWAQLEIGFHIHVEGTTGRVFTASSEAEIRAHRLGEVVLRTFFQWPLEPNA